MFDYQAGEKYKLTLIMVGFAGLMAGILFTMLLMPPSAEPPKRAARPKWADDPDTNGGRGPGRHSARGASARADSQAAAPVSAPAGLANAQAATELLGAWLPLAWDLSASTAAKSQEQAIMYMTPECAAAYRQSVWNPDTAKQVQDSGLQTTFSVSKVLPGQPQNDGSIIILVEGTQVLSVPGKGSREQPVKYEYLVKQTQDGLRIAGISDGGASS